MLSPHASIFGNLSHATGKAMLALQRSTSKALSVNATEVAISKGNSGDASYSARLSSLSDRKRLEVQNMQNFVTYGQIQQAGIEHSHQIVEKMSMLAGSASNSLISSEERALLSSEFESLKASLESLVKTQFQGHYLFQESIDFSDGLNEKLINPTFPNTYEGNTVDSDDDTYYRFANKTNSDRWTATKDVKYDSGTFNLQVNSGDSPERFYLKQGNGNILFDTSWWMTKGNAYNHDFDQFVIKYGPNTPTTYEFTSLDSDNDGIDDNAGLHNYDSNGDGVKDTQIALHGGSTTAATNFLGNSIITNPGVTGDHQLSVVVEARSLFQANASLVPDFSKDILTVKSGKDNISLSPALLATMYDIDLNSVTSATTAAAKLIDEVESLGHQLGNIGSALNQVMMSADRLSSYVIAEQSNLAKKERDYAGTAIDLVKKNLRSDVTSSLLVQARGINRNLVSKLF